MHTTVFDSDGNIVEEITEDIDADDPRGTDEPTSVALPPEVVEEVRSALAKAAPATAKALAPLLDALGRSSS